MVQSKPDDTRGLRLDLYMFADGKHIDGLSIHMDFMEGQVWSKEVRTEALKMAFEAAMHSLEENP